MERLTVLCAKLGLCSRAEAARYIRLGLIAVDGKEVVNTAAMVPTGASVVLGERGKRMQAHKATLMLHKPKHYVSCRAGTSKLLARSLLIPENRARTCPTRHDPRQLSRLSAADNLDESLAGVLVFSQDGRVATQISRNPNLEQEFTVQVAAPLTSSQQLAFQEGLAMSEEGKTLSVQCSISEAEDGSHELRVTMQGPVPASMLRQTCSLAGLRHTDITRTRIGRLELGDLAPGQWTVVNATDIMGATMDYIRWPSGENKKGPAGQVRLAPGADSLPTFLAEVFDPSFFVDAWLP